MVSSGPKAEMATELPATRADHRDAIVRLLYCYAECMDRGDFEAVGALFASGEISAEGSGVVATGHEQVRKLYEHTTRRYEDGTPKSQRLHLEPDRRGFAPDDETATARSRFTVLQAVPGAIALQPIIAGRYEDAFARVGATWHFSRRHMIVDLVGDLSQHLLIDLGD